MHLDRNLNKHLQFLSTQDMEGYRIDAAKWISGAQRLFLCCISLKRCNMDQFEIFLQQRRLGKDVSKIMKSPSKPNCKGLFPSNREASNLAP